MPSRHQSLHRSGALCTQEKVTSSSFLVTLLYIMGDQNRIDGCFKNNTIKDIAVNSSKVLPLTWNILIPLAVPLSEAGLKVLFLETLSQV